MSNLFRIRLTVESQVLSGTTTVESAHCSSESEGEKIENCFSSSMCNGFSDLVPRTAKTLLSFASSSALDSQNDHEADGYVFEGEFSHDGIFDIGSHMCTHFQPSHWLSMRANHHTASTMASRA
jgi:hypothetical protein